MSSRMDFGSLRKLEDSLKAVFDHPDHGGNTMRMLTLSTEYSIRELTLLYYIASISGP